MREKEQKDKLHLDREKEDKNLDRLWVFNWSLACVGFGNARMGEKKSQAKIQHKNIESIL